MRYLMKIVGFGSSLRTGTGSDPGGIGRLQARNYPLLFWRVRISDDLPRLRDARRLIRNYQKATKDSSGTLDLMLHYMETGTEFTNSYGDIKRAVLQQLESVLVDFARVFSSRLILNKLTFSSISGWLL